MRVSLTRDSVAMGDDADAPHLMVVDLPDGATVGDFCGWVRSARPIASVAGGSTWALRIDGRVVAVVGDEPRELVETSDRTAPLPGEAHLEYLLHDDLETVVDRVRLDPTRTDLRGLARGRS